MHQAAVQRGMRTTANLRSIPKGPALKKADMFSRGGLKSMQFAPRGHGYYDAFVMTPDSACVSATTGPATCVSGFSSDVVPGGSNVTGSYDVASSSGVTISTTYMGNASLVIFNPGSSDNVIARIYKVKRDSTPTGVVVDVTDVTAAQFDELGPAQGNPKHVIANYDGDASTLNLDPTRRTESIPLRGSVRIRNITEALSVGGTVRALRYNGGLQLNADTASNVEDQPGINHSVQAFVQLCSMVRDSPRTKIFNGDELRKSHQSNTYPADFVRSMSFECDTQFAEAVARPGYCNLVLLIDDFTASNTLTNNSYEITFMAQRAARFGIGTILGGMARPMKVRPLSDEHAADERRPPLVPTDQLAIMPFDGGPLRW